jgi:nitrite reductase (cytochrome c-552)
MREKLARLIALGSFLLVTMVVVIFGWRQESRMPNISDSVDPVLWAALYPQHYASFMRNAQDYGQTTHGGSTPYDKLAARPFRARAWAGSDFALEHRAARGHHYAQIDQQQSRRTLERDQPAGCINCHAAEAPLLIEQHGWEGLHAMRYDDVREQLHFGTTCTDCHNASTMALAITRPALLNALRARDIDPDSLNRQQLRTYVCAQCHVEYYFSEQGNELIFPWAEGTQLEDMERYYDSIGHTDWVHAETGAPMIKIQHPDYEHHSTGIHARLNVSCSDCHMPSVREEGVRITDHWIRSPLTQTTEACMGCHRRGSVEELEQRTVAVQDQTVALLLEAETAISELMDAIVDAMAAGASDEALAPARQAHRSAQMRWDFADAENSVGLHSSRESARLLGDAVKIAKEAVESLSLE